MSTQTKALRESCYYRGQWSDKCTISHFKTAEGLFPGVSDEELMHRAEELAINEKKVARAKELAQMREVELMSVIDWED